MIPDFQDKLTQTGQELMPDDGVSPDFRRVKYEFQRAVTDNSDIINQSRTNFETRFSIWGGQSYDGKKHSREGSKVDPTPWDGASDLRTFLVDEAINVKVAQACTSLGKANLVAVPIEGGDMARAKAVTNLMRWLVYTQIPNLERECELLANYIYEKGVGITGQFWETCEEKTLDVIKIEDIAKAIPDAAAHLEDPALQDGIILMIQQAYPSVSDKKAKKMIKELVTKGETTVPVVGKSYTRPVIRAFNLDEDIFIHPSATDIETAPAIFRVQYFTPERLRSFVSTDGWSDKWVEAAIKKVKSRRMTALPDQNPTPATRNILTQAERFTDLVGVVFAYEKLSDEDGVPGVYLSVFNPDLPESEGKDGNPAFAKFGLLGYKHGQYPFTLHRREYLSRRLHDSRGLPEPGKPYQDIVKACRDSRIDAASISVIPPLMYPTGRPPVTWGPGSRVPYRRDPGEYRYADRPAYDTNNQMAEQNTVAAWREYCGVASPEGDPMSAQLKQQFEVGRFLTSWADAFGQIWKLFQQYGKDETWFRVIGVASQDMQKFDKGKSDESYDFYLSYDVISQDYQKQKEKLEMVGMAVQTADRGGQINYPEYLSVLLQAIDPAIAERIIMPSDEAGQKAVEEEQSACSQMFAGFDKDIKLGSSPQIGLSTMQNWMQAPDVQARFQSDPAFKARVEKRAKQYQFQQQQLANAKIGKYGA